MKKIYLIILASFLLGCNKEQEDLPAPVLPSIVEFQFENVIDGVSINLDDTEFQNALGQIYKVKAWKYFVSNIEFYKNGELLFEEKDSYHYINQADQQTLSFELYGVDEGSYDEVRYSFGIDEASNNMDARGGDLDIPNGMIWPMDGYRFSNFDGESVNNGLAFHVGGNSNYKQMSFNNGISVVVKNGERTLIHNMVNVAKMFTGTKDIDFTQTPNLATEATTADLANNIANGMFMIHHIENPE